MQWKYDEKGVEHLIKGAENVGLVSKNAAKILVEDGYLVNEVGIWTGGEKASTMEQPRARTA